MRSSVLGRLNTDRPFNCRSEDEKGCKLCLKTQHVIDIQIHDNKVIINYILLFDGLARISRPAASVSSRLFPLVVNDRWQVALVRKEN